MKPIERSLKHRLAAFAARLPTIEIVPLILMLAIAGGAYAFFALAGAMTRGSTRGFDQVLIVALRDSADQARPIGPGWLPAVMRDITGFGSDFALGFISLAVAGWLVLARKAWAAFLLFASLAGALLMVNLLKHGFARPRPELVAHGVQVSTYSFPSSHALVSTGIYLTLGVIAMRYAQRRALKIYALAVPILLALLIGISRVYLGVHWPTDVLAGWALGAAWACLIWLVALLLQRGGEIERPGGED